MAIPKVFITTAITWKGMNNAKITIHTVHVDRGVYVIIRDEIGVTVDDKANATSTELEKRQPSSFFFFRNISLVFG